MSNRSLVRPLVDGAVDVVGDIHGERAALADLMHHLGYGRDGFHSEGRHLVFVGDLTDRGPASAEVVTDIQHLVDNGCAQCVLGNHELNILLNREKADNGWFFAADALVRQRIQAFFRTLPLALERPDLRVFHAHWNSEDIALARQAVDVLELYESHRQRIEGVTASKPPVDPIERRLTFQNDNPVKRITSGPERRATKAGVVGGKMRTEERVEWWLDYAEPAWSVFGHYSIRPDRRHVFGRAVCVDFCVGSRHEERAKHSNGPFTTTRLAAARFPEQVIVLEDGRSLPLTEA